MYNVCTMFSKFQYLERRMSTNLQSQQHRTGCHGAQHDDQPRRTGLKGTSAPLGKKNRLFQWEKTH